MIYTRLTVPTFSLISLQNSEAVLMTLVLFYPGVVVSEISSVAAELRGDGRREYGVDDAQSGGVTVHDNLMAMILFAQMSWRRPGCECNQQSGQPWKAGRRREWRERPVGHPS
jgi:hypothetical protein